MKRLPTILFFLASYLVGSGQDILHFADSIRIKYRIPELAFAVVSADTVFVQQTLGVQRINSDFAAKPNDRFHLGSNTKAITAFLAALLVEQEKVKWNTRFLDLFPELKQTSRKEYRNVTLQELLTFRGKLPAYTYTFEKPTKAQIKGDDAGQRFQLARYFLSQPPMRVENGLTPSNADYVLAGLMLEKASGKSFQELVTDFGKTQGINFGFDYPNVSDTLQPWGHDGNLKPLPPSGNYKLRWLLAAGNINCNLPDYLKFIQLQLKGLQGRTRILSPQTFENLLYGLPTFSFGWFNKPDTSGNHHIASNEGNAGAFITQVQVIKELGKGFIIFTNSATEETSEGVALLMNQLKTKYGW